MSCHATALTECWHKFWICRQFADNFEDINKPSNWISTTWLILLVIRLEPLNSDAVWWVSASYQPIGRVTHLSITLILQCSAQDCKSCNAKLQNLFQSPISQTVKNAWGHEAWGHGFKSYFRIELWVRLSLTINVTYYTNCHLIFLNYIEGRKVILRLSKVCT